MYRNYPDEEILGIIVPDSPCIRPVACHPRGQQEGRDGLVEEEVILNQLVLLFLSHIPQRIVLACRIGNGERAHEVMENMHMR